MIGLNPRQIIILIIVFLVAKKGFKLNNLYSVILSILSVYMIGRFTEGRYGEPLPEQTPMENF